jgi:hypothetical protein
MRYRHVSILPLFEAIYCRSRELQLDAGILAGGAGAGVLGPIIAPRSSVGPHEPVDPTRRMLAQGLSRFGPRQPSVAIRISRVSFPVGLGATTIRLKDLFPPKHRENRDKSRYRLA